MSTTTTTFDFQRAVEAAIEYVEEQGAVTFMGLHDRLAGQFGPRFFTGEETMSTPGQGVPAT